MSLAAVKVAGRFATVKVTLVESIQAPMPVIVTS